LHAISRFLSKLGHIIQTLSYEWPDYTKRKFEDNILNV